MSLLRVLSFFHKTVTVRVVSRPLPDTLHMLSSYHLPEKFARIFYKKPKKKKRNIIILFTVHFMPIYRHITQYRFPLSESMKGMKILHQFIHCS